MENISLSKRKLKIFTFIWNTESIRLGESDSLQEIKDHRQSYLSEFHFPCEIPDFFPSLMAKIIEAQSDLVVIAFQESAKPGDYFHSHYLQNYMPRAGYQLIKRIKMMGIGQTTYKAMLDCDLKFRGLRTSIYATAELSKDILAMEDSLLTDNGHTQKEYICTSYLTRNKGGTSSLIRIPGLGTFAFINAHLPFNSQSLLDSTLKKDPMIRQNDVQHQNISFNEIYQRLILDLPVKPNYVVYMGDFNYRIKPPRVINERGNVKSISAFEIAEILEKRPVIDVFHQLYVQCDELRDQMIKGNIYPFKEGANNLGPLFLPTGKLMKFRHEGYDVPDSPNTPNTPNTPGIPDTREPRSSHINSINNQSSSGNSINNQSSHINSITNQSSHINLITNQSSSGNLVNNKFSNNNLINNQSLSSNSINNKFSNINLINNHSINNHLITNQSIINQSSNSNSITDNQPSGDRMTENTGVVQRSSTNCFKTGIAHHRCPSWCDRILYHTLDPTATTLICEKYERFDVGQTMKKSDHAGVIGIFSILR